MIALIFQVKEKHEGNNIDSDQMISLWWSQGHNIIYSFSRLSYNWLKDDKTTIHCFFFCFLLLQNKTNLNAIVHICVQRYFMSKVLTNMNYIANIVHVVASI